MLARKILVISSVISVLSGCGSTDSNVLDENNPKVNTGETLGLLETATPTFRWPAVANAQQYRLVVTDTDGNGYAKTVDPLTANCASGTCSTRTDQAYFNNELDWYVDSIVDDNTGPISESGSFISPISTRVHPVTSNASACEVWPSVHYDDSFILLNNTWGAKWLNRSGWSQTINVDELTPGEFTPTWSYNWLGEADGGINNVKAYPEVIFGNKLGTHISAPKNRTGLPEKVSELPQFDISFKYSETGLAERNVALESFFHDSCTITGPCHTGDNRAYEMMVWVGNPTTRTPGGILAETGVMIDGRLWDVYVKPNEKYIAFTAQTDFSEGTLNWNSFVNWTQEWTAANSARLGIEILQPEFCMGAIELGTEVWWGQGTFSLDQYAISVR